MRKILLTLVLGGLGLCALGGTSARADIILTNAGKTQVGSEWVWSYGVSLKGNDVKLMTGDFFTIYDFQGYDPATTPLGRPSDRQESTVGR